MQFIDLHAQQARIKADIDVGIANVMKHGQYILGPEVTEFEEKLAAFAKAKHAISCANGTDAIILALMAWGIGPGDAVFCPSFTYCATAEAICLIGATPVFVDIDRQTYNMNADSLRSAISTIKSQGELRPRAVIIVDLFGQIANYDALMPIIRNEDLKSISDSAQGFGSTLKGQHPLSWVDVQTTSFFPAKPLGCYGDGGAALVNDDELNDVMRSLRFHGRGDVRNDTVRIGMNSRLDSLQAAILLPKLAIFQDEIEKRNVIASRYSQALSGSVKSVPFIMEDVVSTWAQYTIEAENPDALFTALREKDIPSARYYPLPVHKQTIYQPFPIAGNGLPNTISCSLHTVSLPMHPYLEEADQDMIIEAILDFHS